jgi:hypothetical protein
MSDRYDGTEFNSIRYLSNSSGGLGSCPDGLARIAYYGVTGFPTLVWQGTEVLVGAGTDVINGGPYDAIVQAHIADATPWAMEITDFSWGPAPYATVRVELEENVADISNTYLRIAVIEDDLLFGSEAETDVLRDIIADLPITINTAGQVQTHTANFAMGVGWLPANMRIVAFIQRDGDKSMLQSCNTIPTGDWAFRYYSVGDRVVVSSGSHEFGDFALFNMGDATDTYDLSLDTSRLPGGWTAHITDGVSTYSALQVTLAPGERVLYNVVIETGSAGGGAAELVIHSQGEGTRTADRRLSYSAITPDTQVLLVDDDGGEAFESTYYGPALGTTGRSYAVWDRSAAPLTAAILANFDVVVWDVGFAFPTLDAADRAAIGAYLDGGGALFVSGQDLGWELATQLGAPVLAWYRQYLHANFVLDDTNDYTLDGVPGDPISDGMSLVIQGGDGANNQEYPDAINAYDAPAHVIFKYTAAQNGAIAADTGVYRVVYLGFGFEAISTAANRALLMQRAINWLVPDLTGVPEEPAAFALRLEQNLPNPFNPKTTIRFALPSAGEATLRIFDASGRRVATLVEGPQAAGPQEIVWEGRDDSGNALPTGMYFYRLQHAGGEQTRKMLLLK